MSRFNTLTISVLSQMAQIRLHLEEFFEQEAELVAQQLLGRELVRRFGRGHEVRGRILEVSAWVGGFGDRFSGYTPGMVAISTRYGKHLVDLVCGERNSCVTLINAEYEFGGQTVRAGGPGNLSRALQIGLDFEGYNILTGRELRIEGESVNPSLILKRNRQNVPANCQGYFYIR